VAETTPKGEREENGEFYLESSKLTKKEGRREKRGETLRWNPLVV
jgi:hypothetical protein